jgi:hypothetical protein
MNYKTVLITFPRALSQVQEDGLIAEFQDLRDGTLNKLKDFQRVYDNGMFKHLTGEAGKAIKSMLDLLLDEARFNSYFLLEKQGDAQYLFLLAYKAFGSFEFDLKIAKLDYWPKLQNRFVDVVRKKCARVFGMKPDEITFDFGEVER